VGLSISKRAGLTLFIIFIGSIVGGAIGELIGAFVPESPVKSFFLNYVSLGFSPITINLHIIQFTLGLTFRFNIVSIFGILLLGYLLRWLY